MAGGSRLPTTAETVAQLQHTIRMNGSEVFKFAVRAIEESTLRALEAAGLTTVDIDCFIAHQANIRIIQSAAKSLKLPAEKVFANVDRYGNTSSASIPIALDELARAGSIKEGERLLFCALGAGFSWGSAMVKW